MNKTSVQNAVHRKCLSSYARRATKALRGWALEKTVCGFMEGQQGISASASQLFGTGH